MLTPEYLTQVPDRLVELYAQAEADILADMARRINGFDMFIPSAQYQLQVLEEMGGLREDIIAKLAKLSGKSKAELAQIMRDAGIKTLRYDGAYYKAAGLAPPALAASPYMQAILVAGLEKTGGLFTNLTKTTARTATQQFEKALDRAYMKVSSGAVSYRQAVQEAVKELAGQGIGAVRYPSGHVDSIEVAVRRAVITGVNQTNGLLQEARAAEMGCDLVEVTAHSRARPEHAEWQGQVFSLSGKSKKYRDLRKATGYGTGPGLKGWNCSHDFKPYIEGMPLTYSKELLNDYGAEKYTYNGKAMTEYEALQQQRYIERGIRRWKREEYALKAADLPADAAKAKVREWNAKQLDFVEQTGLKRQRDREQVAKVT